ncbi:MAG: hypothetical protein WCD13_12145 [Pseudolabrys sp.]
MRRRDFISLLGGAVAVSLAARAQQGERIRRVGVLGILAKDDPEAEGRVLAFQQALAASGWTEGVNVRIDYRWAGGDADRVRKYATELITLWHKADIAPVLRSEDRIDHSPDSVSRCRELIAVAVSQIDGDPVVGDRLVDPALEITVAHFKKIIALQRAGRRNPMTHENAEDLTANVLIGRSVRHRSTIGFARHRSYGRTATVDKIAQPVGNLAFCRMSAFGGKADIRPTLRDVR